jgi:hypothetical protein
LEKCWGELARQVNGTKKHKKHIEQILVKFRLETLQNRKLKIIFPTILMFYVQVFRAKHFQLLANVEVSTTQEEHYFLTLQKS